MSKIASETWRRIGLNNKIHGETHKTGTYRSWQSMKTRCYNPKAINFKHYGGRGITICKKWRDSYLAFK